MGGVTLAKIILKAHGTLIKQILAVTDPNLLSDENPDLYITVIQFKYNGKVCDDFETL